MKRITLLALVLVLLAACSTNTPPLVAGATAQMK